MTTAYCRDGETFSTLETFSIITCSRCGIPFGVPDHWRNKRQEDKESFYCPNGHVLCYTTNQLDKLRREIERKDRDIEREKERAAEARSQRDAARKTYRRMRDRVKNGVCPCCNRTFENLLRHMRTKHADFGNFKILRVIRESYGMTQADLAREIGVQTNHVSLFENDRRPTAWALDQIEAWIEEQGEG